MAGVPTNVQWESRGLRRLTIGAGLGLGGGIAAIVLPAAFLYLSAYNPGGFFGFTSQLLQAISILVLAGALLFIFSLLLYRSSFWSFRRVDSRFSIAASLCLIGTLGFLLIVVGAALLVDNSASVTSCLHGRPTQALSCLRSAQPLGSYTALAGFVLGWLGGLGIVLGLLLSGLRYHRGWLYGGAILYTLLLLVLIGPFVAELVTVPYSSYFLLLAPLLVLFAPAAVFGGAGGALSAVNRPVRVGPGPTP